MILSIAAIILALKIVGLSQLSWGATSIAYIGLVLVNGAGRVLLDRYERRRQSRIARMFDHLFPKE